VRYEEVPAFLRFFPDVKTTQGIFVPSCFRLLMKNQPTKNRVLAYPNTTSLTKAALF